MTTTVLECSLKAWALAAHLKCQLKRQVKVAEEWLSGLEHLPLFQRIQVWFPVASW